MSTLTIAPNRVAAFHYTLTDDAGTVLDRSADEPMVYLHGHHNIVPGLERQMEGMASGDKKKVSVSPADGYGERQEGMTQPVPRGQFPPGTELQVGMPLHAQGQDGNTMVVWIEAIEGDTIFVTANHPLAGVTLHFEVEVTDVRDATDEERAHGHAHGPGGHQH